MALSFKISETGFFQPIDFRKRGFSKKPFSRLTCYTILLQLKTSPFPNLPYGVGDKLCTLTEG
ncbi:hypothetical protein, partial [Microcystis aeruginosa]|uniref:hypothetical protein n=1 Tax=Microcystis aeruginosa TaxID=1126 RepID=UPI001C1110E8